jgi:NADH dehydrogenase [ubiquinone] 1 alpha subcomplex assembly factor 7
MGIRLRVNALVRNAGSGEREKAILEAAERLVDPIGMGKEYKVMGIVSPPTGDETTASSDIWPFVEVKEERNEHDQTTPR